jgi:hypothetical protein
MKVPVQSSGGYHKRKRRVHDAGKLIPERETNDHFEHSGNLKIPDCIFEIASHGKMDIRSLNYEGSLRASSREGRGLERSPE